MKTLLYRESRSGGADHALALSAVTLYIDVPSAWWRYSGTKSSTTM